MIALRTTYTEGPATQSTALPANISDNVYSLSVSAVLFLSFVIWFVWSFCSKRFLYRFTAIEIGLSLFTIAAIVAGFTAANKRAAITDFAVRLAPILMAVLLVQILDSQAKIKLLLAVIAALGVVSAYQCAEQFLVSNQIMIEQYQQAPQTILEPLRIEPGSFQQFLFEHRLYTRGVRGFFTTSNSAGSFALLASFAAVALFIDKFRNRKSDPSGPLHLFTCGIAAAAVIFGLAITKSKGAIAASLIAAAMFAAYLLFGNWLKRHKKAVLILCLLLVLSAGCLIVSYGLTRNRLPGGGSMLVRWQYWQASAQMYIDHPLTGVGPGNFAHFYPHYKPASALETVADPHNFLLSILTQYGPLGLAGFLGLFFVPLWRATSSSSASEPRATSHKPRKSEPAFKKLAIPFLIVVSAALLVVRPMILPVTIGDTLDVIIYVIFTLYVAPVIAFVVGFWLLTVRSQKSEVRNQKAEDRSQSCVFCYALSCAVLGVLIHNLIDFAIFEPGVFTALWAIIACLVALDFNQKSRPQSRKGWPSPFVLKPAPFAKVLVAAAGLAIISSYFWFAWWPVYKTTKTQREMQKFGYTHKLLERVAEDDPLDPTALSLNGRLYMQHYDQTSDKDLALLEQAADCFLRAAERDKADFKNYEKLSAVYNLLARPQKAYDWGVEAVKRYPGSGRLRIELAKIAEKLGKTDIAIEHYKEAIDIEDKYRRQFQRMYPGREIFSRLGEEKYQFAKQRITHLSK